LSRESIAEVAASIASASGIASVNMRALAAHFGVAPMTLYRHVESKEDLLGLLADRMLEELELPDPDAQSWQDTLIVLFTNMHRLLLAHPELAEISIRQPVAGRAAYRGAEAALHALSRGGIEGDAATSAFTALVAYTQGFSLQRIHTSTAKQLANRLTVLQALAPDEFPHLTSIGPSFLIRDSDRHFQDGLRALIRGLDPQIATP
jgi:AcrR family transcriptional regulator